MLLKSKLKAVNILGAVRINFYKFIKVNRFNLPILNANIQ